MSDRSITTTGHLATLDGWRGISIFLVLAAHLLPLGPKSWSVNEAVGVLGMALIFNLSGFLITRSLLTNQSISDFLIRRFFRIVPLAWLTLAIVLPLSNATHSQYWANFLFYANLPPYNLIPATSHFWSLGVEMQFYLCIAIIIGTMGRRGFILLPLLCLMVTIVRITIEAQVDIVTWRRVDEILAGAVLALFYHYKTFRTFRPRIYLIYILLLSSLLIFSSHPLGGGLNYLRPYISALLIGFTLVPMNSPIRPLLCARPLRYLASVSFSLYVVHHLFQYTWLNEGDTLEKYTKRPILFLLTFIVAHLSTHYFERWWIEFGKRLSSKLNSKKLSTIS